MRIPLASLLVMVLSGPISCKGTDSGGRVLGDEPPPGDSGTVVAAPKVQSVIEYLFGQFEKKPRTYPDLANGLTTMTGAERIELLIPNGRSLQRDHVNFTEPRIVMTFNEQPNVKWPTPEVFRRLYIGFSALAKQAEVISWNDYEQQFEFFLIKDFGDPQREPKLEKQDRNACLLCHQNEGPIFTPANWPETNGASGFTRNKLAASHADGAYWYVRINQPPDTAGKFQATVESVAFELAMSKTCREFVCAGNAQCWYDYLSALLLIHRSSWPGDPRFNGYIDLPKLGRAVAASWPAGKNITFVSPLLDISVNGSVSNAFPASLATQNPVKQSDVEKTLSLDPKQPRGTKTVSLISDFERGPEATDENYRDLAYKVVNNGSMCVGLSVFDDNLLNEYSLDQLKAALTSAPFKNWVLESPKTPKAEVMRRLLLELGVSSEDIPSQYYASSLAGGGSAGQSEDYGSKTPTEILSHFCGPCHQGESSVGGKLPLGDLDAMKAYHSLQYDASISEVLASKAMPPLSAEQLEKIGWSEQIRKKVVDALQ